jgi:REP element-mobilizing transposase RayT
MPVRKDIRLQKYDYSQPGCYFVTICTAIRNRNILCSIDSVGAAALGGPHVTLTSAGQVVQRLINNIDHVYPNITVDTFAIMPDHVHLILDIHVPEGGSPRAATPTIGIPQVINALKGLSAKQAGIKSLWQRGYYDHIIRGDDDLDQIRQYIQNNPLKRNLEQGGWAAEGGGPYDPNG